MYTRDYILIITYLLCHLQALSIYGFLCTFFQVFMLFYHKCKNSFHSCWNVNSLCALLDNFLKILFLNWFFRTYNLMYYLRNCNSSTSTFWNIMNKLTVQLDLVQFVDCFDHKTNLFVKSNTFLKRLNFMRLSFAWKWNE